jgi:putative ABC transport system permease protein
MRSFTLVRKNLFRKKLRFSLLFISILIAFFLYGMLISIKDVSGGGGDAARADRLISINKINFTQPLPISYVAQIRAMDGIKVATHATWFGGYFREARNFLAMFAVDPATYLQVYDEIIITPAARKQFLSERSAILVGKDIATKYSWKVGQKVPIFSNIYSQKKGGSSWDFIVAGIWTSNKKNFPANNIVINYNYFNETRTFGIDKINQVIFLTKDPAFNVKVKTAIDARYVNSANATDTITEEQFAAAFLAQVGNISFIITLVVGVSFLTILIIVGNTMVMAVRERTREIGIMKTLGFSGQQIMAMVLGESMFIALIGGISGLLLANVAIVALRASGMLSGLSMNGIVWVTGLLWMVLLGLLTAAIPAYNAVRLNIVTALGRN